MESILLDLGFIQIYWYSVLIFLGLFVGGVLVLREAERFGFQEDFIVNLFFYLVPYSIIGARLYYVLFNLDYYLSSPLEIFSVWNGGLAIHGALLFGLLWIFYYTTKYRFRTIRILDFTVVGLLIGQAIGRWGNFFNQEAYGGEVSRSFLENLKLPEFIINGMNINGVYHHPTFLYESIGLLIGFILILFLRRFKYTKVGHPTSFYLVWYGLLRFFIEFFRTDSLMWGNFRMAQITSTLMIFIGVFMIVKRIRGSVFDDRYNEMESLSESRF
jgi:phosphatidylglycerol:prolipoprotein diacylglycerol transferase